jgi:hypothetical protein
MVAAMDVFTKLFGNRKRPAIRAFQIRLTHEIVCPLIGKLSGTHDERYGAFRS